MFTFSSIVVNTGLKYVMLSIFAVIKLLKRSSFITDISKKVMPVSRLCNKQLIFCFTLIFYVPVNRRGHVWKLYPFYGILLIVPRRYFCGGSFCFMSWCWRHMYVFIS